MKIIQNPVLSITEEDRNAIVDFMDLVITQCQNRKTCADCIFYDYCDGESDSSRVAKRFLNFFIDGEHVKIERE